MVYVALAEAAVLLALTVTFAGLIRSMLRSQARERDLLLNKIMHLAGRTWEPPPAAEQQPPTEDEYLDFGLAGTPVPAEY